MSNIYKYQRTYHFSFSEGVQSDDKILKDLSNFEGQDVVATIKMDGENTTLMREINFARSINSNNHPSRDWVKGLWGKIRYDIPEDWRICGENLYAKHSIHYEDLKSYFMVFNIWNENNFCLNWDDTVEWCKLLNLETVKVIYSGVFDIDVFKKLPKQLDLTKDEGFVVRLKDSFHYDDFSKSVVKWVRKNHVQTDSHWTNGPVIPNKLIKE